MEPEENNTPHCFGRCPVLSTIRAETQLSDRRVLPVMEGVGSGGCAVFATMTSWTTSGKELGTFVKGVYDGAVTEPMGRRSGASRMLGGPLADLWRGWM